MDLNQKIKSLRKALNLSQTKLSEKVGVSLSTLRRWETGERQPSIGDTFRLAVALQTTITYLTGEMKDLNPIKEITNIVSNNSVANVTEMGTISHHIGLPNKEETIVFEQGEGEKKIRLIFPQGTSGDVIAQVVSAALK